LFAEIDAFLTTARSRDPNDKIILEAPVSHDQRSSDSPKGDPKLPNARRRRPRRSAKNDEWLATDKIEAQKSIALIVAVVAVLAVGVYLIISGLAP